MGIVNTWSTSMVSKIPLLGWSDGESVINDLSSNWTFTASVLERFDNLQSLSTPPPILGREKNKKS